MYAYSEMRVPVEPSTLVISSQIGEVQQHRVGVIARIRRSKTHQVSNGAIGQILIVRAQSCICDSPLAERVIHRLVVLPFVRVGSVVHSDLEVLGAAEKEISIVGELS